MDGRSVSAAVGKRLRTVEPVNPKRPARSATTETWFSYYAGYADSFVRWAVETLELDGGRLLDPWNGAGTTTSVATDQRLPSVGLDLNPAAVVIARARLLRSDVDFSVEALAEAVIASARRDAAPCSDDDPLRFWFDDPTATRLRALERAVYRLVVSPDDERRLTEPGGLDRVDALAALFYLGLFRIVRPLIAPFVGSNPTWIRRRVEPEQRLRVPVEQVEDELRAAMRDLLAAVAEAAQTHECATVRLASSSATGLDDASVDAVITSPPYCTRIDYVIATLPELAVLGIRAEEMDALRSAMIGTPVVRGAQREYASAAPKVRRFLDDVEAHDSYAAKSYYWKFFRGYFEGMERSIVELHRVVRPGSPLVFVAQDSWFKQLRVPVPELLVDIGEQCGWELVGQHDYAVATNRAGMHPHGRTYRSSTRAIESVLVFTA